MAARRADAATARAILNLATLTDRAAVHAGQKAVTVNTLTDRDCLGEIGLLRHIPRTGGEDFQHHPQLLTGGPSGTSMCTGREQIEANRTRLRSPRPELLPAVFAG
jgi:hypothetical protein